MTNKKKLKDSENKIYINDDLTLLRARLAKALRQRQDVTSVNMINNQNDTKLSLIASSNYMNGILILSTLYAKVVFIFVRGPSSLQIET